MKLQLRTGHMFSGLLFTKDFISKGITDIPEWNNTLSQDIKIFQDNLLELYSTFPIHSKVNEPTTEKDLIWKILECLGFKEILTQQTAAKKGRSDIPDILLFENSEAKIKANLINDEADRYKFGIGFAEAKAWEVPLDHKSTKEVPSTQILRYLHSVDIISNGNIKFGILTNGRHWRLYWQDARSRSEEFFELDLPSLLNISVSKANPAKEINQNDKNHLLKVFYLIFHKNAFINNNAFHHTCIKEAKLWQQQISDKLSKAVFTDIYPQLPNTIVQADKELGAKDLNKNYLNSVRDASLILLYRLLFIFYAEDRELLPVKELRYQDYSLRKIRTDIQKPLDESVALSSKQGRYYNTLKTLFTAIDDGDESLGIPPYNGGLFATNLILDRISLPDDKFAELLDKLSRHQISNKTEKLWINYRDLSVQQLGSVYESLLEWDLKPTKTGDVQVQLNTFARKNTGSYYTPENLVKLIISKTIDPLIYEIHEAFANNNSKDPAEAILDLKICDPAMGSGHFLVTLIDYLSDEVLKAMELGEGNYSSPLEQEIENTRQGILNSAKEHKWIVYPEQLENRQIVRRMVLKRCVYGVDKNSMAVELAKVSLWLHTFTVGAPLSFLDHHLRCGDSLFGEFAITMNEFLEGRDQFIRKEIEEAQNTAKLMMNIERLSDADITSVKKSGQAFKEVSALTSPLAKFMSIVHAFRWLNDKKDKENTKAISGFFDGVYGNPIEIAAGKSIFKANTPENFISFIKQAQALAEEQNFLNWEVAFPGVWKNWLTAEKGSIHSEGGFDAVIGNPPWDRIKLQELEWFELRFPDIATAIKASDRKKMITELEKKDPVLYKEYCKAQFSADTALRIARESGFYPLLSKGDTNLYRLFVERAQRLVKSSGITGLLVPSGIASDETASTFFKGVATDDRLAYFYDFENKKAFFPHVHSSFKFCAIIAGGEHRRFKHAEIAFFLHDIEGIEHNSLHLTAQDFDLVNPNTATAPIFRTQKDAELTLKAYKKYPILQLSNEKAIYPVKYSRMFDMTNDSNLFHSKEDLKTKGYYPVEGNRWKKGDDIFVPLYEGKMVQAYNHRAANIIINFANVKRPAQQIESSNIDLQSPNWFPNFQYYVNENKINSDLRWILGFKQITAPTNIRTMIAAIIPYVGAGNSYPVFMPRAGEQAAYIQQVPLLLANFNSFALDFIIRQKIQAQVINKYMIDQFPVVPYENYKTLIGQKTAEELIKTEVLKLTYTAYDLKAFAEDMGYKGEPFIWNEEDRAHSLARLDAIYFMLYSFNPDEIEYIMNTFTIVKRKDQEKYNGKYFSYELIIAYYNAFKSGDTYSKIQIQL